MWFSPIFERFVEKSPVTVILRGLMEVVLAPSKLDDLFEQTAQTGYTKEILFSTLVKMMTQVVCSVRQSIGSVYKATSAEIGVSKTAVYDKLNRLEPCVSQALVRYSAREMTTIIEEVRGQRPELLPGYRVKILDGNGLGATEHRLSVLLDTRAGALPGKSLVVLSPALGIATDIFIETLFQVATENFHCEIKTLGYPRAALFSFCMAKGSLQSGFNSHGSSGWCSW